MRETYPEAVTRARLEWLERAFREAGYSVLKLSCVSGVNRTHLHRLLRATAPHLPRRLLASGEGQACLRWRSRRKPSRHQLHRAVERARRAWVVEALGETDNCVWHLSRATGTNRQQLYKLIARYAPHVRLRPLPVCEKKVRELPARRATGGNAAWRALSDVEPQLGAQP